MKSITTSDRKALIRLASSLPKGSKERRAILKRVAARGFFEVDERTIDKAKALSGVDPNLARYIVDSGLEDGQGRDDVIPMGKASFPAGKLKPSQTTMRLSQTLGMAIQMLLGRFPMGGDLGAIISADGHILDGHHRWSAAIAAAGPSVSVGGYLAKLPGKELIKVLNIVTKGEFGRNQGNPGSGNLSEYTPGNAAKMLLEMTEKGGFKLTPDDVKEALTKLGGSVEGGVKLMAENIGKVSKAVPSWAPKRSDMPVIDEKELAQTSKILNKGLVNWRPPFEARTALTRLASVLPKGSPERRNILNQLQRMAASKYEHTIEFRRPFRLNGKQYTGVEIEIDRNSIYLSFFDSEGNVNFAEIREDLSNPEFFDAAVDDVSAALFRGELPDGFSEHDFS